ncbi:MAG TPA: hypothetical protein VFE16_12330 [Candidatus Cybelea sp.]|nr:hypothetical protein [Candidatus Cybelea sp.]
MAGQRALAQRLARGTGEVQYFSDSLYGSGTLFEFDYPKGESPIGSISFSGGAFCTKGARTFWTTGSDEIAEFKVGGATPIRVLKAGPYTSGCAIDPATGNLAALDVTSGGVTIFHKARGKGKVIGGSGEAYSYFDAYDNQSNLFVDGFSRNDGFALVELKKGSSALVTITTSNTVEFPGSVQWDGKYLAVTDQGAGAIYRYTVGGTNATLKGTVLLSGATDCAATWIARPYVYCADAGNSDGEVFKYPAGGTPIATLSGLDFPLGVVSLRVR